MADKNFCLKIVTPHTTIGPVPCDSVKLTMTDGKKKKQGGSYGIRQGHAEALISLDKGTIEAFENGKPILTLLSSRGIARVKKDGVTVTVSEVTKKE